MKQPYHGLRPMAGAAICAVLFFLLPATSRAAGAHVLSSHVPSDVALGRVQASGSLPDTNLLRLAIGLPLRDRVGLDKLFQQLYDPKSPKYHHYLSVEQFTEKFGPSKLDYDALRSFAEANHLTVTGTHPNRMLLDVEMSVADIRRVFHVNIRTYKHPSENRQFYAPDSEPTLDLAVPVLHISGLDNYTLPRPADLKQAGGKVQSASQNGSGPGGNYIGYDFRHAYVPG
jgi:subtilase family serine protease